MEKVGNCKRCGDPFWMASSNQKYCPICSKIAYEEKESEGRILYLQRHKMGCHGINALAIANDMAMAKRANHV
ncbi:MAG: hypothetical protein H6Q67_1500 [Firmicutes bacterium]|nr:hypothetical protein [Bacillota bacterium]